MLRRLACVAFSLSALAHGPCTHDKGQDSASRREGTVLLHPLGRTVRVHVEVVRSPEERAKGLMYRRELPALHGMLFLFETQEVQSFWMKNTYIPLDLIFIDEKMKVAGVTPNAEPLTETSRKVDKPSRFVLEVNAGFAQRHGVTAGTRVTFEGVEGY